MDACWRSAGRTKRSGYGIFPESGLNVKVSLIQRLDRRVLCRIVELDLARVELRLVIDWELVRQSFLTPPIKSIGRNLPDYLAVQPQGQSSSIGRLLFASNTLHTNFVRGNGFVIANGDVVCKPVGAVALDGSQFQPLNGDYTVLVLGPGRPAVMQVGLENNRLTSPDIPRLAISGPRLVQDGANVACRIPTRLPSEGQTAGDEVNFLPERRRSSFTAFGAQADGTLLAISCFAGEICEDYPQPGYTGFLATAEDGLTLSEVADLMIDWGVVEAIAGGGSGDTQQYVRGQGAWLALTAAHTGRPGLQSQDGLPVVRGLGAILLAYETVSG